MKIIDYCKHCKDCIVSYKYYCKECNTILLDECLECHNELAHNIIKPTSSNVGKNPCGDSESLDFDYDAYARAD